MAPFEKDAEVFNFLKEELAMNDQMARLGCLKKINFIIHAIKDKTMIEREIVPYMHV